MDTYTIPDEMKEQYLYSIRAAREKREEFIDWIKGEIDKAIALINKFDKIYILGGMGARLIKATPTIASHFLETYSGQDKEYAEPDMVTEDDNAEVLLEYAMSLATATENVNKGVIPTSKDIDELREILIVIKSNFSFLELSTDIPSGVNETEHWLTTSIKQETMHVRGNGYQVHITELFREMFQYHDDFLNRFYHFNSQDVFNTILKLDSLVYSKVGNMTGSKHAYDRFTEWLKKNDEESTANGGRSGLNFIKQFTAANPDLYDESAPDKIVAHDINHINSYNKIFWVIPQDEKEKAIFNRLCLEFKDNNAFLLPPRFKGFILNDTLIKLKPLVKQDDKFYNFSLVLGYRNVFKITEELLKSADQVYYDNSYKNNSNSNSRDNYIERKTKELFQKILPEVKFYHSLEYTIQENGQNKRTELDILGVSKDALYIIEVKAGELNEKHRRGALKGLKDRLSETIGEGSYQCHRALKYIQDSPSPTFDYALNNTNNVLSIDKSSISNYYKISVTYDYFTFIATNLRYLVNAGILSADYKWAWVVSIYDLMVFADLINSEEDFKEYLNERINIYERSDVEFSDELDVLGFFLDGNFPIPPQNEKQILHIINSKEQIDTYYNNLSLGIPDNIKPTRKRNSHE